MVFGAILPVLARIAPFIPAAFKATRTISASPVAKVGATVGGISLLFPEQSKATFDYIKEHPAQSTGAALIGFGAAGAVKSAFSGIMKAGGNVATAVGLANLFGGKTTIITQPAVPQAPTITPQAPNPPTASGTAQSPQIVQNFYQPTSPIVNKPDAPEVPVDKKSPPAPARRAPSRIPPKRRATRRKAKKKSIKRRKPNRRKRRKRHERTNK
jgi:hypothetical protein